MKHKGSIVTAATAEKMIPQASQPKRFCTMGRSMDAPVMPIMAK